MCARAHHRPQEGGDGAAEPRPGPGVRAACVRASMSACAFACLQEGGDGAAELRVDQARGHVAERAEHKVALRRPRVRQPQPPVRRLRHLPFAFGGRREPRR